MTGAPPLVVRTDPGAVARVVAHVERHARAAGLDAKARYDLRLAVEELVTNIVRHGYAGDPAGTIEIDCREHGGGFEVILADRARRFDPDRVPPPDLDSDWPQRRIGGLGWYLARSVVDGLVHEPREGGGNRWRIAKGSTAARREESRE